MKRLLILLLFALGTSGIYAQEITTIILVRHAEKGFDEAGDPDLTEEGEKRASELQRVLQDTEIDFIYSTPFKRTKQTVKFLAEARDLEVLDYNPFKLDDVISIINDNRGKTILFSGHSNTTPVILNKLVGEDRYRQLDDKDYDNLYIVTYLSSEQAKVVSLEYGEDSEM
ncbi:MAG: phosphoglycerate mutase family protein [Fulvivirga sp.]